jgi:hypothetical protein
MACWSVFEPPGTAPGSLPAADGSVFVKEGWCWPALLVPPVWLLWRRMWLPFLLWLAVVAALAVAAAVLKLDQGIVTVLDTLFALWFALEANAMRRWSLHRKGWRFAGIAAGSSVDEAELRHFQRHFDTTETAAPGARPPPTVSPRGNEGILGVFPERWDSKA